MKRIVVTGPESSGKTTLCRALATAWDVPWVSEYAREYLQELSRLYRQDDLVRIAQEQWRRQQAAMGEGPFLFCDTGLLVLLIWSEVKYGQVDPWITQTLRAQPADLYLLCRPDIPWEPDPLRENPDDREDLFVLYQQKLHTLGLSYRIITGALPEQRLAQAQEELQKRWPNKK